MDLSFLLPLFLLIVVFGIAVFTVILEFYMIVLGPLKGAPYVPSKREKIRTMLELARIKPGEIAVDLGSGNGAVVIEAALQGARAIGIEINPFLTWYAKKRARRAGVQNRATFIRQNFKRYSLENADVVFLYLLPKTTRELREKLSRELKPEARVVSNTFQIPEWEPIASFNAVFLYQPNIRQTLPRHEMIEPWTENLTSKI